MQLAAILADDQSDSDDSELSAESAGGTIDWDMPLKLPRSVLLAARQARAAQDAATHSVCLACLSVHFNSVLHFSCLLARTVTTSCWSCHVLPCRPLARRRHQWRRQPTRRYSWQQPRTMPEKQVWPLCLPAVPDSLNVSAAPFTSSMLDIAACICAPQRWLAARCELWRRAALASPQSRCF